jgi:hypothetical protein
VYGLYGQRAYEGYRDKSEGKSLVSGDPIPLWDDLPDSIKNAWAQAAFCAIDHFVSDAAIWAYKARTVID